MRRSKAEIYLHFVWATWERESFITADMERALHRCVVSEAQSLRCDVLAVGGMPDHVHLVVKVPTSLSAAEVAKQVKGPSSTFAREKLRHGEPFGWQDGYGVFSIGRRDLDEVISYVRNQKQHHASGELVSEWESTFEEVTE